MITKVTILNRRALSWEIDQPPYHKQVIDAYTEISQEAYFFGKTANVLAHLSHNPECEIEHSVRKYFGEKTIIEKKKKGKNWYVYAVIGGLYIHATK